MKHLLLALCLMAVSVVAQVDHDEDLTEKMVNCPFDANNKINYNAILEFPGLSKTQIRTAIRNHVVLKNPTPLIDDSTQLAGISYLTSYYNGTARDIQYTYKLLFKDGKVKYEITDLILYMDKPGRLTAGTFGSVNVNDKKTAKYPVEERYARRQRDRKKDKMSLNMDNEEKYGLFEGIEIEVAAIVEGYKKAITKSDW